MNKRRNVARKSTVARTFNLRKFSNPRKQKPGRSSAGSRNRLPSYKAGLADATSRRLPEGYDPRLWMNRLWNNRMRSRFTRRFHPGTYKALARRYVAGFCARTGWKLKDTVLLPSRKKVGAIVTVMNEARTIPGILRQLNRLPLDEIIVVVNGSNDESFPLARAASKAIIVHVDEPLGHDVGRAVGAKLSQADILLFLDGDLSVKAEELVPFVEAVERGMDVALNDISPFIGHFSRRDAVTVMKEFLNRALTRADLGPNSLTAVPHALSRKAVHTIGCHNLMVPPLAQSLAIQGGLRIGAPASVDVIRTNRVRAYNVGKRNLVSELILGDHMEAVSCIARLLGPRLAIPDRIRNRTVLEGGSP